MIHVNIWANQNAQPLASQADCRLVTSLRKLSARDSRCNYRIAELHFFISLGIQVINYFAWILILFFSRSLEKFLMFFLRCWRHGWVFAYSQHLWIIASMAREIGRLWWCILISLFGFWDHTWGRIEAFLFCHEPGRMLHIIAQEDLWSWAVSSRRRRERAQLKQDQPKFSFKILTMEKEVT